MGHGCQPEVLDQPSTLDQPSNQMGNKFEFGAQNRKKHCVWGSCLVFDKIWRDLAHYLPHILISGSITPKGTRQGPLQQWLKCVTSIRHRGVAMTFWPLPTWVSHHQPLFHFTTTTSRRLPWQWPRHLPTFQVEVTFKTSFARAEGLVFLDFLEFFLFSFFSENLL